MNNYQELPIVEIRDALLEILEQESVRVLLKAPTGSGKSTCVPLMLDEAGYGERGLIVVVQPRRMAARLLSTYVAKLSGNTLGREIGYVVRFERRMSAQTRIVYVTDGMLERWLTDNPQLEGVSAVIFDEFHERSLSTDISLGRVLELQETTRTDLAVVVMSATIELQGFVEYLGEKCHLLEARGRQYPVEMQYRPPRLISDGRGRMETPPIWEQAVKVVCEAAQHPEHGDVLVFMPGVYEIRKTIELLESKKELKGWDFYPLYGALSPELQNKAVEKGTQPRVIVSTNVAETSLTIEGVCTVIDSGLMRQSGWDPYLGMDSLRLCKISQASATQRAGRAGRIRAGRCFRLWSEQEHHKRPLFETPECMRVDLSGAILHLFAWGVKDVNSFRWLDSPNEMVLTQCVQLLKNLGAIQGNGELTAIGERMMNFPLAPRLARMLIAGEDEQCYIEMAAIAALLQGESIAQRSGLNDTFYDSVDFTDFQAEWRAVESAVAARYQLSYCTSMGISVRAVREVLQIYRQLLGIGSRGNMQELPTPDFEAQKNPVIKALLMSFSDQVGCKNGVASNTCRLVGDVGGKLADKTVVHHGEQFISAELVVLSGRGHEVKVGRNTLLPIDVLKEVMPHDFKTEQVAEFDSRIRRVRARELTQFRDLVLVDKDRGDAPAELAAPCLAKKVVDGTLKLTKWDDSVEQWIRRLNGLADWMPELEMPHFTEADKFVAIELVCEGAVGYKDIKDREILPILKDWLSDWQAKALEDFAPTTIQLSNGQKAKLRYGADGMPVTSIVVQRLFGVAQSPRIANGAVTVKVEVLAPNQRPWQVTTDLESFWRQGYAQMKKDLAGRYTKHQWPDASELV